MTIAFVLRLSSRARRQVPRRHPRLEGVASGFGCAARALAATVLCGTIFATSLTAVEPKHVNVLFILADDLRADAVGVFGGTQVGTPNIDRLAARGAAFSRTTCGYPICNVSRSEILVGRSLLGAGMPEGAYAGMKLEPSWVRWPALMLRSGWHTVYSGKWHVSGTPQENGYAETAGLLSAGGAPKGGEPTVTATPTCRHVTGYRGWTFKDSQGRALLEHGVGLTPNTDNVITEASVAAIQRLAGRPFFLHVNYTAPHDPLLHPHGVEDRVDHRTLSAPPNFRPDPGFETGNTRGRDEVIVPAPRTEEDVIRERALYFTLVGHLDTQVGRLVRALEQTGELSRTLIVFASDHGVAMGSHGLMGKQNQYEHSINVPLILAGPGVPAGRHFSAQSYLRDLYPTVCDLVGVPVPSTVQGKSLQPVLTGAKGEIYDSIFGYYTGAQRMIREPDGWKLIWYPVLEKHQLFNVSTDPDELRDLSTHPAHAMRLRALHGRLSSWQRAAGDPLMNIAPAASAVGGRYESR